MFDIIKQVLASLSLYINKNRIATYSMGQGILISYFVKLVLADKQFSNIAFHWQPVKQNVKMAIPKQHWILLVAVVWV